MKKTPVARRQGANRTVHKPDESQPPRILVVEDDDDIRRMNSEVLLQSGYSVDAAENGAVAWGALKAKDYDLVITDNTMPELSGLELLRKMHAAHMVVPVIMASGTMPWREFADALWLQPAATLVKPYSFTELLSSVRAVLGAAAALAPTAAPPAACPKQRSSNGRVVRRKAAAVIDPVRRGKANRTHGPVTSFAD